MCPSLDRDDVARDAHERGDGVVLAAQKPRTAIDAETEAPDDNRDAPIPEGATVTPPNRGRTTAYSIRVNPDQVAAPQSIAGGAGVPGSTLDRSWIMDRFQEELAGLSDAETEPASRPAPARPPAKTPGPAGVVATRPRSISRYCAYRACGVMGALKVSTGRGSDALAIV